MDFPRAKDGIIRTYSLILAAIILFGLSAASPVFAEKILLISNGDASNDTATQSVLQSAGDTVTIGPTYNKFSGSGLSGYNAVFLNPVNFTLNAPDMPASGQQALVNFVNQGGGLVTGGGVVQMLGYPGLFQGLSPLLPSIPTSIDSANSPITFTSLTSNSTMNAGLPGIFSFTAGGGVPTEQLVTAKPGATAFFTTNQWTTTFEGVPYGVVGWNYGSGHVLSLSTFSDSVALSNATYDQMLTNAFNWVTQTSPTGEVPAPEPTSLTVFAAASVGLLIASRMRQRRRG
jgi:hypothetical protein